MSAPPEGFVLRLLIGASAKLSAVAPIYAVAIAVCLGDGLGNLRWFASQWLLAAIAIVAAGSFIAGRDRAGYIFSLIAIVMAATLLVRNLLQPPPSRESIRRLPDGAAATVEGMLADEPEHLINRTHLKIRVRRAAQGDAPLSKATGTIRVTVLDSVNPRIGDEISVTSRIRFPRNNGNPGEYDYAGFMARSGISATMTIAPRRDGSERLLVLSHHPRFPFTQLQEVRDRIADLIDRSLPPSEAGEMRALIIGDRSGIDDNLRDAYARTGMAHLLVISGLHLGFVAAAVFGAVRFLSILLAPGLASRGWANKASAVAASLAVCAYAAIAGHHVSTVRAMVMVLTYMMAIVLDRASEAVASLALAAIVICVALPGSTADIGFQLSFASVLAIVLGMRRFAAWMDMRQRRGRLPGEPAARGWVIAERPLGYVAVSFWAMIGTAPLTAFHFNQVSFVGLVANAVVVPIMGFGATVVGLVGAAFGFVSEAAAERILWLASFALDASNWLARWFSDWPEAWIRSFTPTPVEMVLAYALIALWLGAPFARVDDPAPDEPRRRWIEWRLVGASIVLVLVAIDAGWWCCQRFFSRDLRVTFLSVGEGDAAVVRFPGGRVMLIDGGGAYAGFDYGERVIAPYLWSQKILHVDYLVLSHPDADHFGGFGYIASNFTPGEFWTPSIPSPDRGYVLMLIALMQAHVRLRTIDASAPLATVGGVAVNALVESAARGAMHNNGSLILRLAFGRVGYLFSGDIEAETENALVEQGADLHATVLKVPHHGSRTSSTASFIRAVHPEVAVISDGYLNRFHFPAPEIVTRYREAGVTVLRTDLDGAVMTDATPGAIQIQTYRGTRLRADP